MNQGLQGEFLGNRGSEITFQVYKGDTIFCDSDSIKISVPHQFSFTAEDTIISNLKFDSETMGAGFPVESYSIDNGFTLPIGLPETYMARAN